MMESLAALKVLAKHRGDPVVITTETTTYEWPTVSSSELDMPWYGAMGMASSVGLGLALAQPKRKIIVIDADGSLLMNLQSLVTIANMAPANLIHFVMENGVYRSTGGQPIPNAGKVNFTGLAKAAGYPHTYDFDKLEDFEGKIAAIMKQAGPTLVCLKLPPLTGRTTGSFPSMDALIASYHRVGKAITSPS